MIKIITILISVLFLSACKEKSVDCNNIVASIYGGDTYGITEKEIYIRRWLYMKKVNADKRAHVQTQPTVLPIPATKTKPYSFFVSECEVLYRDYPMSHDERKERFMSTFPDMNRGGQHTY